MSLDAVLHRIEPRIAPPDEGATVELVCGHLAIGLYVPDRPKVTPVTQAELRDWNVTVQDLLPQAIANLRRSSDPSEWSPVHTVPGMQILAEGQAANRMLILPDVLASWPLGGVLVACPSPHQLLCVPLHSVADLEAVRIMATAVHFAHAKARVKLSDQLYWHDGTAWHHVRVAHWDDEVEIQPPSNFLDMVSHLAAMDMVAVAGEA